MIALWSLQRGVSLCYTDEYPWVYCQGSGSSRAPDQAVPVGNSGFPICYGRFLGGELLYPTWHKFHGMASVHMGVMYWLLDYDYLDGWSRQHKAVINAHSLCSAEWRLQSILVPLQLKVTLQLSFSLSAGVSSICAKQVNSYGGLQWALKLCNSTRNQEGCLCRKGEGDAALWHWPAGVHDKAWRLDPRAGTLSFYFFLTVVNLQYRLPPTIVSLALLYGIAGYLCTHKLLWSLIRSCKPVNILVASIWVEFEHHNLLNRLGFT
jgi:hypothetical protein